MTTPQQTSIRKPLDFGDLPPKAWFTDPALPCLTPITVTREGRILGHIAGWGVRHRGVNGYITPPRSRIGYEEYVNKSAVVAGEDGDAEVIAAANLTMGIGHAPMDLGLRAAAEHYDNSNSIVAQIVVGEDDWGIWYSGAVLPDVEPARLRRLVASGVSGDWRRHDRTGGLELCAALAVACEGFSQPPPRARVASGAPQALVAAGIVPPAARFGKRVAPGWTPLVGRLTSGTTGARVEVDNDGGVRFYEAPGQPLEVGDLADVIAERIEQRRHAGELSARHAALVAELDDTPAVVAALLAEVDDSPRRAAALLAELDEPGGFLSGMPPQLKAEWLGGEIAARIAYGTPGQFARCQAIAREKGIPGAQIDGMCADLIREATGRDPGDHDE